MQRCFRMVFALALFAAVLTQAQPITTGRLFKFAFPYNAGDGSTENSSARILVSSEYDSVQIEVRRIKGGLGAGHDFVTGKAGTVLTIDASNGPAVFDSIEITPEESERVSTKVVSIHASEPVTVTVINARGSSSEGWKPMPAHLWGTEYRAVSYWDQTGQDGIKTSSGFVVVPYLPGTSVQIILAGQTDGTATTVKGRKPGDTITVNLAADDAFAVMGSSTSTGVLDLTGSKIVSTKPIAVIGFHGGTTVPACVQDLKDKNHLVESIPPVHAWSTEYITTSLRRISSSGQAKGDVFRVIANEDDTQWSLKYYDPTQGQFLGSESGTLKAGDFHTIEPCTSSELPYGTVVITANKPILAAQYSTSSDYDNAPDASASMTVIPASAQFVHQADFLTPTLQNDERHVLKLTVRAPSEADAMSVELDGVPVWDHPQAVIPKLLLSKVPSTQDMYTATIELDPRATLHTLRANEFTRFGGYAHTMSRGSSLTYPVAGLQRHTAIEDTEKPDVYSSYTDSFDRWRIIVNDRRGSGVESVVYAPGYTNSGLYVMLSSSQEQYGYFAAPTRRDTSKAVLRLYPRECKKQSRAVVEIRDHQENLVVDTLEIAATTLEYPEVVDFGVASPYQRIYSSIELRNSDSEPQVIFSLREDFSNAHFIVENIRMPVTIAPGETIALQVSYIPLMLTPSTRPYDSLLIRVNSCADIVMTLRGRCAGSSIGIYDKANPANHLAVGSTRCDENCITVKNQSVEAVTIQSVIADEHAEISIRNVPQSAFVLQPGEQKVIGSVCYTPKDIGPDSVLIQVVTATGYWESDIKRYGAAVTSASEPLQVPEDVVIENLLVHTRINAYRVTVYDLLGRQLLTGVARPGEPLTIVQGFVTFQRVGE